MNCKQDLQNSEFLSQSLELLKTAGSTIKEIVCLGIGHISDCSIAKHQLAFISIIAENFGVTVKFFDPVLTPEEKEVLQQLNHTVLDENKEGKYVAEHPTLFYLPHCPKQITNNLLFANWTPEQIKNVFLICNSFKTIIETTPERFLRPNAHFILEISPFASETGIENNFRFTDIFNDFSVISFPVSKLELIPSSLWLDHPLPVYTEEDLELIQNGSS